MRLVEWAKEMREFQKSRGVEEFGKGQRERQFCGTSDVALENVENSELLHK